MDDRPCEWCERRVERGELAADDPQVEVVEQMERDYERWLDKLGGSR